MAPHTPAPSLDSGGRGLWTQTATIDWCEQNYELSYYVAEFWNTLSNLAFILPQLYSYFALKKYKSVEPFFRQTFLSLALTGIGSVCFHMTLNRSMQMFDETSMILVSLHSFYLIYTIWKPNVNRQALAALLICYGLAFLSFYVFLVDRPIFHHSAFLLLIYASVAIGYRLKARHGPYYKFWTVFILQHSAGLFWLIDKHYCEVLTQFREHHVPMLLRPAFQFHAIWHLLMGLGTHVFICGLIRLRAWTEYKEEFVIRYKLLGLWITLEKVDAEHSPLASIERKKTLARRHEEEEGAKRLRFRQHRATSDGDGQQDSSTTTTTTASNNNNNDNDDECPGRSDSPRKVC